MVGMLSRVFVLCESCTLRCQCRKAVLRPLWLLDKEAGDPVTILGLLTNERVSKSGSGVPDCLVYQELSVASVPADIGTRRSAK
jgi:hypothetical protein